MCKSIEGINGTKGRMLDWIRWISQVALVPLLGLAMWGWWNHEGRIVANTTDLRVLDGNRFTSADGLEVWREISDIQSALDSKADAMGAVPMREAVTELKERVTRLERDARP